MRHYQRGIATSIILIIFLLSGIAIVSAYFVFSQKQQRAKAINSFEDCAKYYPVMESYPQQCSTPNGRHFTNESNKDKKATEELESLNNRTYSYDGQYFEGIFYKFTYPLKYKASSGAYGCNPIIIKPEDESDNDSICLVEDTFHSNNLEGLLDLGYGETLVNKENISVKDHPGIFIETKGGESSVTITAAVGNVPLFLRGMKPKIETGILVFSYSTNLQRKENARQVLQQILDTLEIQSR